MTVALAQTNEISTGTVRDLHTTFMQGVYAAAREAVEQTGHTHLYNDLVNFTLAATRRRQPPSASLLAALAATDEYTILERTQDLLEGKYFSAAQQKKLDAAAANRKHHAEVDAVFGDQDRIYLEVQYPEAQSKTEQAIRAHLSMHGYTVTDYIGGYATDAAGKNQMKIGRLLQNHDKLKWLFEGFNSDTTRVRDVMIVLSRNPTDIARMSAGRHWGSCMSPHRGEFDAFAHKDIEHGTLVAYLVRKSDPEINDPISRVLIKPYADRPYNMRVLPPLDGVGAGELYKMSSLGTMVNWLFGKRATAPAPTPVVQAEPEMIFVSERKTHGGNSPELRHTVDQFVAAHLNHGKRDGAYYLSPELYCDTDSSREYAKQGDVLRPVAQVNTNPIFGLDY